MNKQAEQQLVQPERLDGYHISMRQMQKNDIELARQWRNLPHVRQMMLDTAEVSTKQQQDWFQQASQRQDQWHFIIDYQAKPIGVANIKSLDGSNMKIETAVEIGLYIGEESYRDNMIAFAPNLLLIDYCFEQFKLDELHAVVKKDNEKALQYNYALGYREIELENRDENELQQNNDNQLIKLKLTQDDYNINTKVIKAFLKRS